MLILKLIHRNGNENIAEDSHLRYPTFCSFSKPEHLKDHILHFLT